MFDRLATDTSFLVPIAGLGQRSDQSIVKFVHLWAPLWNTAAISKIPIALNVRLLFHLCALGINGDVKYNRINKFTFFIITVFIYCTYITSPHAQNQGRSDRTDPSEIGDTTDPRPAKGIQDNSFLIEEGYNQEAGIVQSIAGLRGQGRNRFFAFTQEFPLGSQTHQVSYSLPASLLRNGDRTTSGIGDLLLNYRYQVLFENDVKPAFAPRFSLILPTGNQRRGIGSESFGFQSNLPFSKTVDDRLTLHANAGMTSLFDVEGRSPISFNLGGSAVYAATRDFNILFEVVGEKIETVNSGRRTERERVLTLSPGIRYAFNFPETQIVIGVGAPASFIRK